MARVFFRSVPFNKNDVTLALEAGVDGIIVPREHAATVAGLARCDVWPDDEIKFAPLNSKQDEEAILSAIRSGEKVLIGKEWEIIPIENLLAQSPVVMVEAETPERAKLAAGILERGVSDIIVPATAVDEIRKIVAICRLGAGHEQLFSARITKIARVGLGHRVCLDTLSLMQRGQGMLVGNSSAFTFLVHAETEHNEYVASRPFRVNAGGVHAYIRLPGDRTTYLGEVKAGEELLTVNYEGQTAIAILGRVKIEVRPMLYIEAEALLPDGEVKNGSIFLQNAETIRLTAPDGTPLSVVKLRPGDEVLCKLDEAGRHFGMRVTEEIQEK